MEITMKNSNIFIFTTIILSLLFVNVHLYASVIHVPADQRTIQSGIDAAENGDTVLVADGTYKGEGNVNIDFKGKQIAVKSQNGAEATIIHCLWTPNTRGFIFQNEETHDSVLDGFTIKNGVHEFGGGIYCNNASPTIKNCVIEWNKAAKNEQDTGRGGGIYCFNSDAKIIGSTISRNIAESTYGGGVYFDGETLIEVDGALVVLRETSSQPSLLNCTISDNTGSGVHIQSKAHPEIKDSKILHNSRRGIVCGFFSRGGTLITNCEIAQNTGGGVECSEFSIMKITDSTIRQNTAREGGGIYCSPSGIIEVSNCIIAQNIATRWGGGICVDESKWGQAKITNCTITRNTTGESGGGISVVCLTSFTLTDSIVWGNNSDKTHAEISVSGRWIVIKSNDIRDGLYGIGHEPDGVLFIYEDNIDADPLFVDADRGDYRLKENSPAAAMGAHSSVESVVSVASVGKRLVKWAELKHR